MLANAKQDHTSLLLVTPEFQHSRWKGLLTELTVEMFVWTAPLYLDEEGRQRPRPRWDTRFSLLQPKQ